MTCTVCEKPPDHDRSYPPTHDCSYRSFWHITSHWYREIRICDKLASTQKNYEVVRTRVCTSRRSDTRERVHLSMEPCTPSCDTWPFPSLNVSTQTPFLHTLQYYSTVTDLSLVIWWSSGIEWMGVVCQNFRWRAFRHCQNNILHSGLGRVCNMKVCDLVSDLMWRQHGWKVQVSEFAIWQSVVNRVKLKWIHLGDNSML